MVLDNVNYWVKKHRTKLSAILGIFFLVFAKPTIPSLLAGVLLIILGEALRIWSSGYIHKNEVLSVTGPYSLTRNPLYVGSFLLGTGFVITMNVPWVIVLFMLFFGGIYWFTIRWEEEKLQRRFDHEWVEYSKAVPRFFPMKRMPKYIKGEFNLSQVIRNKEIYHALVVFSTYIILWGKAVLLGPN